MPSYLTAWPSRDLVMAARQQISRDWWLERQRFFNCYISQLVVDECSLGDQQAASRRLDAIEKFPLLAISEEAVTLAEGLLHDQLVPAVAADDALHIGLAAVHGMKYLLTWNFKHIANAVRAEEIRAKCLQCGYICPVICTPEELLED